MANRRLTVEELKIANTLLDEIRQKIESITAGNKEYWFALA